jgi:flagellar protein FliS
MNNNPSLAYRQQNARTASPLGMVVLLYDSMLISLNKAIRAIEARDIELRVRESNRALAILDQLQRTLDFENGGDVAVNLNRLYDACRQAILDASFAQIKEPLVMIVPELQLVRDAWWAVDNPVRTPAASSYSSDSYSSGPGSWSA